MFIFTLYTLALVAVGFLFGAIIKGLLDKDATRSIELENARLHRENENLKRHEVIEIVDRRTDTKDYFKPF